MWSMEVQIITKEDLQEFRSQLMNDLKQLLFQRETKTVFEKPWLRNAEVKKLLNISSNTIQRLRIAGKLQSSKLGGIHYYRYEDIQQLLNSQVK
jgi:hypothetical protein